MNKIGKLRYPGILMNIPEYGPKPLVALPHGEQQIAMRSPIGRSFPMLARSSNYGLRNIYSINEIIGRPFFDYAEAQRWSFTETKRQYFDRVSALVADIKASIGPYKGVILRNDSFQYFHSEKKRVIFPINANEFLSLEYQIPNYAITSSNELEIKQVCPISQNLFQPPLFQYIGSEFFHSVDPSLDPGSIDTMYRQRVDEVIEIISREKGGDFQGVYISDKELRFFDCVHECKYLIFNDRTGNQYCVMRGEFGHKFSAITSSEEINHAPAITERKNIHFNQNPFPKLKVVSGHAQISSVIDIWSIIGNPFFDWASRERQKWNDRTIKSEYATRVMALIADIEEKIGNRNFSGVKISSSGLEFYSTANKSIEIRLKDHSENIFVIREKAVTRTSIPTIPIQKIAKRFLYELSLQAMDQNWKLNEYFGTIYLISGSNARRPQMVERMRQIGLRIPEVDYVVSPGVQASSVDEWMWSRMSNWGWGDGPEANRTRTACFLAHYNVISAASNAFDTALTNLRNAEASGIENLSEYRDAVRRYSSILIFEDNNGFGFVMEDRINVRHKRIGVIFHQAMKELPEDWDMLYLMAWNTHPRSPTYVSPHLKKLYKGIVAKSYAVNHTAYKALIEAMSTIFDPNVRTIRPIDQVFGNLHEQKLNAYVLSPAVCYRHQSESMVNSDAQGESGHWQETY